MKVLVAPVGFPPLSARQVGHAIAAAWSELGAQIAVVPMAAAGADLADALAALWGAESSIVGTNIGPVTVVHRDHNLMIGASLAAKAGVDLQASSRDLGRVIADLVARHPANTVVLEVVGGDWHDGGRGWLEAFDGLSAARSVWGGRRLRLVVPAPQAARPLTGLRGITSVAGRGADGALALDTATLISIDQELETWATAMAIDPQAAGSGAAGGLGAAILGVGGTVVSGPRLIADLTDLEHTLARADLVVTGSAQLHFGSMGGEVLAFLIERAQHHLIPLISVSGSNHISPRELRSIGVEAAYSVRTTNEAEGAFDAAEITEAARRVAQTWAW